MANSEEKNNKPNPRETREKLDKLNCRIKVFMEVLRFLSSLEGYYYQEWVKHLPLLMEHLESRGLNLVIAERHENDNYSYPLYYEIIGCREHEFSEELWQELERFHNEVVLHDYGYSRKEAGVYQCFINPEYVKKVLEKQKYNNVTYYLEQTYLVISSNCHLGAAILLRSCLELFTNLINGPQTNPEDNLAERIKKLKDEIKNGNRLKVITEETKTSVFTTLENIRKIGNDVAHIKKEDMEKKITEHNLGAMLRSICLLIELEGIKTEIEEMEKADKEKAEEEKRLRLEKAINEGFQGLPITVELNPANHNSAPDDDIPF